jgi:diguanylate cyclase (GGDEF)-like protein
MHNELFNRMAKWRRYSFAQEDIAECRPDMVRHNAETLGISSVLAGFAIIILASYSGWDDDGPTVWYCFLAAAEWVIGAIIMLLKKKSLLKAGIVNTLVVVSYVLLLATSCYALVIDQVWTAIELFLIFFAAVQIIFVYDFAIVLAANVILAVFFCLFKRQYGQAGSYWQMGVSSSFYACIIAPVFTWVSSHRVVSEMVVRNRYYKESILDQLTGLGNRRSFEQSVDFYTSVCRRVHQTVCVIMLDVDFFKLYNDTYLHIKGDEVLKEIGRLLRELAESEHAFAARVGGEEFIVLWTENRITEAKRVARKLRQSIVDLKIPHENSPVAPYVTVSIGLYIMHGGSSDTSEELYRNADTALYRAKGQGRDRIVMHDSEDGSFSEVSPNPPEDDINSRGPWSQFDI